jgi:hypothetical protein
MTGAPGMKIIFLITVTLFLSASSTAQQTGEITGKWKLDGKRIGYKGLQTELSKVPANLPLIKKAKTNRTIGFITVASGVICTFLGPNKTKYPYKNDRGFQIASVALASTSLVFILRSNKNLKRAIKNYNEY